MKKYAITIGWNNPAGSWTTGIAECETLEELAALHDDYSSKGKVEIVHVGISLSYANSLSYKVREEVEQQEMAMIQKALNQ